MDSQDKSDMQPEFLRRQYEFTAHIRDPDRQPAPADVDARRMALYRELFYNNVAGFMANSFPVLHEILNEAHWHALMRDYFARHISHTPLFPEMPPICRTCQMPAVLPRPDINEIRLNIDSAGQRHAFCSEACQHIFRQAPERHCGMTWWEVNDNVELWRYIVDAGLLRSDGKTLMGQPHLRTDEASLWTIDDIRRTGVVIKDPLKTIPAEAFVAI